VVGLFGPGWRSNFEERVFAGDDGYMKYSRGDGSFWSFGWTGNSNNINSFAVAGPAQQIATLIQGSANWTLTFQSGEQRSFDKTSGLLTAIKDRNGNATQLTYDGLNRLTTATDAAGRHLYLTYLNSSSSLVSSVSSDVGISLSYTYDGQGRLITVTKPDNTTVSFEYDANSFISAVKDSEGKILESHTYDSLGRGLTSSRANGVESVTVTYPQ
jgi:YD repeat-containing protein